VVSQAEAELLQQHTLAAPVMVLSNIHVEQPDTPGCDPRYGLLFVGSGAGLAPRQPACLPC
jgi:hypothetical protein